MIDPWEEFADGLRFGDPAALTSVYQAAAITSQQTRQHVLESLGLADTVVELAERKIADEYPDAWARSGDGVMRHLRGNLPQVFAESVYAAADPVGRTAALIGQTLEALDSPDSSAPPSQPRSEWDEIRASQRDWKDIRSGVVDHDNS